MVKCCINVLNVQLIVQNEKEVSKMKNILTIKETMEFLSISSYNTFKRNYLNQGLPVISVGKNKRVDKEDLEEFINAHKISKELSNS